MIRKTASELRVGDVFCRDEYHVPDPKVNWPYTVHELQLVPIRDFFGKVHDRIQMTGVNHVLGPSSVTLGPDEPVWLVEGG